MKQVRSLNQRSASAMLFALLFALLVLTAGKPAHAAGCTVSSPGLAFGAYQPLTVPGKLTSSNKESTATISVACTGIVTGGSYTIALGPSLVGAGNGISTRYLANASGGDYMAFNVYKELSYSTIWGDGITAGSMITGSIAAGDSSQSHSVYGKIPAGQSTLKAGSFTDSLTMTLTYNP
jgi:spore coat protein U-like protein